MGDNSGNAKILYFGSLISLLIIAIAYGKIEQDQSYHAFADNRTLLGIQNGLDVISNLAILYPGLLGLMLHNERKDDFEYRDGIESLIHYHLFGGMLVTFVGSVLYHLDPTDTTLILDRFGMAIVIACYCSLLISDFISVDLAKKMHTPIIIIGISTILYWAIIDDLRAYFIFKHQPLILIMILLIYGKNSYDKSQYYLWSISFIMLATLVENLDVEIYKSLGIISGHTLKHIFAGIALWWIYKMIDTRKVVNSA
ncbi:MAG: hypothetical protein QGI21_00785 [Candidatus Poseidoniaceae archaeon]|jgi:hypothetical protein|nr:hypothetical protein [Candidatus Poseidoniaceae archaeon]